MKTISIQGALSSKILIGEKLENLKNYIPEKNVVILTDTNVRKHYGDKFPNFPVIEIGMGEQIKTLQTLDYIYQQLIELDADRTTFFVGIGGGIVCDIAGFVASTFMRGLRFGFVSTTLLSQVDASVGGKNGVNFLGYKNIIGVFCQPEFVICDQEMLKTLTTDDLNCGFAEIIKHIVIDEQGMFSFLEENIEGALKLDPDVIEKLVIHSVETKAGIVNRDERETGERRKLNLGHTFGHAFEKIGQLPHGNAVSLGMVVAANLSVEKGLLKPEVRDRIVNLIQKLKLPIKPNFDKDEVISAMRKDKKRESEHIHFILIQNIGDVVMEKLQMSELNLINF